MQPKYLQEPTKPKSCPSGKRGDDEPSSCHVSGPNGLNSHGVLWRCSYHGRLFVATTSGNV